MKAVRNTCERELDGIGSVNRMKNTSKGSFEYLKKTPFQRDL